MIERIILSGVSVLMLLIALKQRDKYPLLITIGLTLGVLMSWMIGISTIGILVYMLSVFCVCLYGLFRYRLPIIDKVLIVLVGLSTLIYNTAYLMSWPYWFEFTFSSVFPLIMSIILIIKGRFKTKELSFLVIFSKLFPVFSSWF